MADNGNAGYCLHCKIRFVDIWLNAQCQICMNLLVPQVSSGTSVVDAQVLDEAFIETTYAKYTRLTDYLYKEINMMSKEVVKCRLELIE